ncbi:MAG: hypothetical protein RBR32_12175 [Bacteroidales bacterium]|nr:hypothetical protein [Bacteroidales bacterium]
MNCLFITNRIKQDIKLISLLYLFVIIITNSCTNYNPYYNCYSISNGLSFELPLDTISHNRFTIDNKIYKGNSKYKITYVFLDKHSNQFYFKKNGRDWLFVSKDSIDEKTIYSLSLTILDNFGPFEKEQSWYNQSVIKYEYLNVNGKILYTEHTGLVENEKNIWFHPPRYGLFRILQLNPFPYIHFPAKKRMNWDWSLEVGSAWGDNRWIMWDSLITLNSYYSVNENEMLIINDNENVSCKVITGASISEIGTTYLKSFFRKDYGFVKFEYQNIDSSRIIFNITKNNDFNN